MAAAASSSSSVVGSASSKAPASLQLGHHQVDGLKVFWKGRQVGQLTFWGSSGSCRCMVHPSCRSPASTKFSRTDMLQ
eukprot:4720159-Alexandrium_andersonii.AAC.1